MKKCHRTVFQNAWSQKNQHFHWKNNSVSKKLIDSYEKNLQNRLPKCLKPKEKTLSLKKQFFQKKLINSYEKNATEPSYKMLEAKNLHSHWKNNSVSKKLINSYDKNATEPSYNIEKQFCSKKTYEFIGKKGHRTIFQNAWSQKNKHSHWKNNSVSKKPINSYEKRPQNRIPKCLKPKKTTLFWQKQSVPNKTYKFIWKKATEPSCKMPEAKKPNTLIENTILFEKSL